MTHSPASSLHKSRSSSLFSFLSIHPSYISFHNRLPTHPSPPSAPQNHVSIFLTCIHRVRSDHSYKSQVLAPLPSLCTRPNTTRRPSRLLRETGPLRSTKLTVADLTSQPGSRAPPAMYVLSPHHATVSSLASRPRVHHQRRGPPHADHRGHQLINSSTHHGQCADAPCTWRAFMCAASACCLSVVPSRRARQRWG